MPGHPEASRERRRLREGLRGAVARARGLGDDDPRALGQQLGRRGQVVEEQRRQHLRPLGLQSVGQPLQAVAEPVEVARGLVRGSARGSRSSGISSRTGCTRTELTRSVDNCVDGDELAQRLDPVAEEVDANGPARGGGEDVEDAAADGELAAVLDDVGPRVAEVGEPLGEGVGRQLEVVDELRGRGRCRASGIRPCMAARAGATSTKGLCRRRAAARRRRRGGRRPRATGDRPSYGRASQAGRSAVASGPSQASTPAASCSASCGPGATSRTGARGPSPARRRRRRCRRRRARGRDARAPGGGARWGRTPRGRRGRR